MRTVRCVLVVAGLTLLVVGGGCVVVGGSTNKLPEPTVGQQLIDLKRAQQDGAITAEEYERMRDQLVNRSSANRN